MRDLQTSFPAHDTPIWASSSGANSAVPVHDDTPGSPEGQVRPFAQVMSDLRRGSQELQERRQTAPNDQTSEAVDPLESAEQGWVEVPLSARMAVITTAEVSGDEANLAEFARSQGFDEMALAAIFGVSAVVPATEASNLPAALGVNTSVDAVAAVASLNITALNLEGAVVPSTATSAVPAGVNGLLPESAVIEHLAAAQAAFGQAADEPGVTAGPVGVAVGRAAAGVDSVLSSAASATALQAASSASGEGATPAASFVIAFTAAASARTLGARTAPSLTAASASASVLADVHGEIQVKVSSAGALTSAVGSAGSAPTGAGSSDSLSTLARLGWTALVRDAVEAKPGTPRDLSALPEVQALGSEAPNVWPAEISGSRSVLDPNSAAATGRTHETIHAGEPPTRDPSAWADKLAQTMGQRLAAHIAQGHWSLRLSLNPQHLGHIDVDLSLRGKELEAAFQVSSAQTRALLQDSLPRLKDSLNSSGMDVASMNVSGGWTDRDRGNPTPWQKSTPDQGGGAQSEVSKAVASDAPSSDTTPSARPHLGRGVLDVLV